MKFVFLTFNSVVWYTL